MIDDIWTSEIDKNLPPSVKFTDKFEYDIQDIIKEALAEGYYVIIAKQDRVDNIRPDGTYIPFHSLNNEKNELRGYSKHNWPDAVCWISESGGAVEFLSRRYYKGQPTKEWWRHRVNGPAEYTPYQIGWCQNGNYHRDNNLPASISTSAHDWCVNGKWHRSDDGYTVVNRHRREIMYHRNHIAFKRWLESGGFQIPKRWDGWYMIWEGIENNVV